MWVFEKHINLFFADETDQVIQVYAHMYEIFHSGSFSLLDSNVGLAASSFVHFWTVLGLPSFYYFRSIILGILGAIWYISLNR